MNTAALDRWITGNYGYDHPDNQQTWHEAEADRIARAHREKEAYERWVRRFETNEEEVEG